MKRLPVEKIRRLALLGAVVMTLMVAGSYGLRRWRAEQARRAVPAAVPADVQQQAEKFTFSRTQEGQTLFTVEASRTTERAGQTTVLEDVVVHIYGQRGERADEIRTARCEYDAEGTERIVCPGEVVVSLRNAQGTDVAADSSIQLTTTALQFDPIGSVAWTEQPVHFAFPGGTGEAVGLRYQPTEPKVQFEGQVTIRVARPGEEPVHIRGARLDYNTTTRTFALAPPLRIAVGDRTLVADRLYMQLDTRFRTRRIEASGNIRATAQQGERELTMRATRAVAEYAGDGNIELLRASGQVEFQGRGPASQEHLTCGEAVFFFEPGQRGVERVVARGSPNLVVETAAETRALRAPELELLLQSPESRKRLLTARQRGTLILRRKNGEQRTVTGDRIELEFSQKQHLRALAASGGVEVRESRPGGLQRTSSSDQLRAQFSTEGKLTAAEQWGRFRYHDGRWQAQAGRAGYRSSGGVFVLRELPVVWDAATRTSARLIEISEDRGELRAEGAVRTTWRAAADASNGFGTGEPVQLAAERLQASPDEGRARYAGQARLWQGENRLAAATIELFRDPGKLLATGDVSAFLLEATEEGDAAARRRRIRITAEQLTYLAAERRAWFADRVSARNDFGTLTTARLEVFFTEGPGAAGLERVHARGGVLLEQKGWRATSEEGEYRADTQTVVMWGGTPTIHQPQRGTTTGARLTLFLADDTISVDSAEGTRTLTRRSWQ